VSAVPSTSLPQVESELAPEGQRAARGAGPRRILLVCPPFQFDALSSLSTVQLATFLREQGADCAEAYVHFDLARIMGPERYHAVTVGQNGWTGELFFAEALHGELADPGAQQRLVEFFGAPTARRCILEELGNRCLARVEAARPEIVGMTTSFCQLMAALWIARVLKKHFPPLTVVLNTSRRRWNQARKRST
jgi:hypothetical protein